jgi:sterol desaturase/sphingolipid hydroxylase (fatty acid hydroxylase superfamily)
LAALRTGVKQTRASWLAFPAILGGTIALAIVLLPHLGTIPTLLIAQTAGLLAVAISERFLPFRREWNRSHHDVRTDVIHAIVSGLGTTQLVRPLIRAGGVAIAGALSRSLGSSLWPADWPLVTQLALALVIAEFPQYWLHRWQHEHDLLWRFHATHHSAPRLYWLNAARFHPVDLGLLYAVGYLPLVVLGCPESVIMLFALFDAVFGMLQHCNIDVRLGPLNRIFSMAEPHRWHHSRTLAEANTNYGSNLIVWDLLFGTFFLPRDREPPAAIGIADMPNFPGGYLAQLASPFRWRRIRAEAASVPAPPAGMPAPGWAPRG